MNNLHQQKEITRLARLVFPLMLAQNILRPVHLVRLAHHSGYFQPPEARRVAISHLVQSHDPSYYVSLIPPPIDRQLFSYHQLIPRHTPFVQYHQYAST